MSDFREAADIRIYAAGERRGVTFLVVAGVLSILGVLSGLLYYLLSKRTKTFHRTNIAPYLVSLLVANVLQAIATILNARWINEGMVYNGSFCTFQGGLKNAANVGIALWSFVIAVHVFNLLFLRWRTTRTGMIATLVGGWSAVVFIVTLGRLSTETPELGPYFGVSGFWCWITDNYPTQQIYMEYFIVWVSYYMPLFCSAYEVIWLELMDGGVSAGSNGAKHGSFLSLAIYLILLCSALLLSWSGIRLYTALSSYLLPLRG